MVDEAIGKGLLVRPRGYAEAANRASAVNGAGPIHKMPLWWKVFGPGRRRVPEGALIHASVQERIGADAAYAKRLPTRHTVVDADWRTRREM